mmetsp:Transcript_8114/g.14831  ORF Transcript_8114/g.14831 Transcript_8114/m.14831 type:complete len:210 (-) Transcript_8114:513-1142(-)
MDPRRVVDTSPERAKPRRKRVAKMSWVPVPTAAQKSDEFSGKRNTSPWISFQPDSSSSNVSSSNSMYREKSFFSTLMRMMVRNAVRSNTKTNELMMESQWISKELGRNLESAYRVILYFQGSSFSHTHSTEYENCTSVAFFELVMSTFRSASVVTEAETMFPSLYPSLKWRWGNKYVLLPSTSPMTTSSFSKSPIYPHMGRSSTNISKK